LTGPATPFGVAANLGGVSGSQPNGGGLGMQLGKIYADGVNALANGDHSVLPNMVNLFTSAYGNLTSPNLGAAKNYFANGTTDGMKPAVAPAGFTLPTFNGLPNMTGSVYRLAYVPGTQTPKG
jgi:subtilase-type serine protease